MHFLSAVFFEGINNEVSACLTAIPITPRKPIDLFFRFAT